MWTVWLAAALAADPQPGAEWAERCTQAHDPKGNARDYIVCVDLEQGAVVRLQDGSADHPMPHQKIVVLTRAAAGQTAVVEFDGLNGVYKPALDTPAQPPTSLETSLMPATPSAAERYARFVFPPSTPGAVTLRYGTTGPTAELPGAADVAGQLVEHRTDVAAAIANARTNKSAGVSTAELDAAGEALMASLARLERRLAPARVSATKLAAVSGVPGAATQVLAALAAALQRPQSATVSAPLDTGAVATLAGALAAQTAAVDALTVQLPDPAAPPLTSYAMTVEATYVGSLRLGAAVVFGGAAGGKYGVGAPANASDADQLVVVDEGSALPDMELVVGYTQFLRRRPESSTRPRLGFFAALGIAELTDAKVTALQSIHAGVEFGWPGLSAGVALSVRNVTVLGNGLEVGDPVRSVDSKITVERPGVGISLVIFPTPELWKTNFSPRKAP